MHTKLIARAAVLGAALSAAGCAMPPNEPAPPMGAIVSLTMAQQVMNPAAGINPDPVSGIDGKAAKSGYDAYQKSFRAPVPQQNVFTIGVAGNR